ncbi:hypothetical protein DBR43_03235 [Pedobacter sp. KBW06]|nr:hypothetical protein DBR43_03235 [Pedobacter sp. KBW06]
MKLINIPPLDIQTQVASLEINSDIVPDLGIGIQQFLFRGMYGGEKINIEPIIWFLPACKAV